MQSPALSVTGAESVSPSQQTLEVSPKSTTSTSEVLLAPSEAAKALCALDNPLRLDPASFPHQPRSGGTQLPPTIANLEHLLEAYGIKVQYNVIRKKLQITIPHYSGTPDNLDNTTYAHVVSLANLNGLSTSQIHSYLATIGDRNCINPVADWITSKEWDGIDRLEAFCDTLVQRPDFPAPLKDLLIHRWLISAVAAVMLPSGFRGRGVLTLQGPQSTGKTTWISNLVPDPILRDYTVKLDHHLDAGNKDSLLTAVAHWVVEIGELDSSFKKDVARLKGFLTSDRDKVRRPYGRADSEYPRRTVFCATVNENDFLVDATGNTRWWTIPVIKINYAHGIDMQQLFAQITVEFQNGEPWWLTPNEEALLEKHNQGHRATSAIRERILDAIDVSLSKNSNLPALTPTELLRRIGINSPSNTQSKECASVLRELLGEHKRINGSNKWRIPFRNGMWTPEPKVPDSDRY